VCSYGVYLRFTARRDPRDRRASYEEQFAANKIVSGSVTHNRSQPNEAAELFPTCFSSQ
jgi:hypothetical protein